MIDLFYSAFVLLILTYFVLLPTRWQSSRPPSDNSGDGGEPVDYDLPDLDLPPGISLPISDSEPDYSRPQRYPLPTARR